MRLNISATAKTQPDLRRHRRLTDKVLDELLSWKPREFMTAFRRSHHGPLSLIHLNVLMVLESDGPMSMGQLAEELDVSVASMTGIVDRMEGRGLVERRHGETDRRLVLVHPTEGGRELFAGIDQRRREGLRMLLGKLSDSELLSLLVGHRALRKARTAALKKRQAEMPAEEAAHRGRALATKGAG